MQPDPHPPEEHFYALTGEVGIRAAAALRAENETPLSTEAVIKQRCEEAVARAFSREFGRVDGTRLENGARPARAGHTGSG